MLIASRRQIDTAENGGGYVNNWNTKDGTGIRDYVHVWDLAEAHLKALERINSITSTLSPFIPINIGSGTGLTVKEMVSIFEEVVGIEVLIIRNY